MRRLFSHRSSAATVISLIALFFAVGGTTIAATGASAAVAAASGWSIQTTPNPTGGSDVILNGVSCASASACTAVGGPPQPATTGVSLAEGWNGSTWSIQHTPNPAGASLIVLNGVSCASASACTAVGGSPNGTTMVTLAERWNGTKWSIQRTPNPTGSSFTFLYGVSCASASACTAVGASSNGTLAERWNGTTWSIQRTPNPTGGSNNLLQGVSCAPAGGCTAVGGSSTSTTTVTLAERWNGTTWSIQHTPNPTGAQGSGLGTVSCTSASACTAAGAYNTGPTTGGPLAERWNGTKWSIQHTPSPAGGSSVALAGVSCTSATACTAVGDYNNGTTGVTLAERWNGTTWSIQPTPNPTGAPVSLLNGVSCASVTSCTAAGGYNNGTAGVTLAERWNG